MEGGRRERQKPLFKSVWVSIATPGAAVLIPVSGELVSAYRNYCDRRHVFLRGTVELQLFYFEMKKFSLTITDGKGKKRKKKNEQKDYMASSCLLLLL